jgi:hypothetical protein
MMSSIVNPPDLKQACHGLVESANKVSTGDDRWERGVTFSPVGCYFVSGTEVDCPPKVKADPQKCVEAVTFKPWVLTASLIWAMNAPGDPKQIALDTLEAGTSARLEDWTYNGLGASTNLKLSSGVNVGSGDAKIALGMIEQALFSGDAAGTPSYTGGSGTIYVSPIVAVQAADAITDDGNGRLITKATCSTVIVGNFPTDEIAAHLGGVDLYLGTPFITDTYDEYRSNDYVVMAERLALVVYNPCGMYTATVTNTP